jgi:hypothetical protein
MMRIGFGGWALGCAALLLAPLSGVAGCSSDSTTATGEGGATQGAGGTGGGLSGPYRRCGMGAPCASPDATCVYRINETSVECACDASGHFFCTPSATAGAPPWDPCVPAKACAEGGTCKESNGWCEKTCPCNGTCKTECTGEGPAMGNPGAVCDLAYCMQGALVFGLCEIKDATCAYSVACQPAPTISGSCP